MLFLALSCLNVTQPSYSNDTQHSTHKYRRDHIAGARVRAALRVTAILLQDLWAGS